MFFTPFYSLFFLLVFAGGGLAYASRQPGGAAEYLRGPGRSYAIRGATVIAVVFLMNVYFHWKAGV
jgi:hypothetical protein